MKRALTVALVAVLSFGLGASLVLLSKRASIPNGWITIVPAKDSVAFDMDVMKEDIPMPDVGKPQGRVKFLQRDKGIQIGYVLQLPIKPNPVSALPQKYRQETKLDNGLTVGPPDQVSYQGRFIFDLQDSDGFTLAKIVGPLEWFAAASDNPEQGTTDGTAPLSIVQRTKKIAVSFSAEKCNICD